MKTPKKQQHFAQQYMIDLDDDNNLNSYEVSHPEVGYFAKFTPAGYNAVIICITLLLFTH